MRGPLLAAITTGLVGLGSGVHAQTVLLTGSIGNRAILIIDGGAPRTVAPGQSVQGVRLLSMQGDEAVVEAGGKRIAVRMDTAVSVAGNAPAGGGGSRIVLNADNRGHFLTPGTINGRSITFMLDTGATTIALSAADAARIGLDTSNARPVQIRTANGTAMGVKLTLNAVRVGDVEVHNVDAIVSQQAMPYVLLGNSFLNRFSMRRDADQMVLERRF